MYEPMSEGLCTRAEPETLSPRTSCELLEKPTSYVEFVSAYALYCIPFSAVAVIFVLLRTLG